MKDRLDGRGRSLAYTAERRRVRSKEATLVVGQPLQSDEGLDDRFEDCSHYLSCLAFAIKKSWQGFSCASCGDFESSSREVISAAEVIKASFVNATRS